MTKLLALAVLFSAGLQAQTSLVPEQLRPGTFVGAVVCVPPGTTGAGCKMALLDPTTLVLDKSTTPYTLRVAPQATSKYVAGPTGAMVVDNTKSPGEIDIVTSVVPRKGQSEMVTGLWSYLQGLVLSPVALPVCDATNKGRLLTDVADGMLKHCNGEWQALTPHVHWQFRTSTAILTVAQSTFNILDPTIVPDSLEVYRNGILMTLGPDYTRVGLGASASVQFTTAQAPVAGDTVTLKYMW